MSIESLENLEQKSERIVQIATTCQIIAMIIVGGIFYFKPLHYKEFGYGVSLLALGFSFALSRWFLSTGKKIEDLKTISDEEFATIKRVYFSRFFAAYPFWITCSVLFNRF